MPATPRNRWTHTAALSVSIGLGLFVVVHAQLGCDGPASTAPADSPAAKQAAPGSAPAAATEPDPAPTATPAATEPPAPADPGASPDANPATPAPAKPEPVYMPASKSGGDFGAMRFPGEPQAAPNPAPEQAPTQQAPR